MIDERAERGASLAALGLLVAGCGSDGVVWQARPIPTELDPPVVVPLLDGPIPVIEVDVAGTTGRFAVDAGAENTMLDVNFAKRAGLEVLPLGNRVTSSRGSKVARVYEHCANASDLSIGSARAFDLQLLTMDLSHLELDLAGILGMDLLGQWAVVFDAPAGEMRLLESGTLASGLAGVYAANTSLTCWSWKTIGGRPAIVLEFEEGVTFDAILDTGATFCCFPPEAVETLGLEEVGKRVSRHVGGVDEEEPVYRVARIGFGEDLAFFDVDVGTHPEEYGLIGYALLRQLVFAIDGPEETFCFTYEPERADD